MKKLFSALLIAVTCLVMTPVSASASSSAKYSVEPPKISKLKIVEVAGGYGLEFTLEITSGIRQLLDYYVRDKVGSLNFYGEVSVYGGNFFTIDMPDYGSPAKYDALDGKRVRTLAYDDLDPSVEVRFRVQFEFSDSINGSGASPFSNAIAANMPEYIANDYALDWLDIAYSYNIIPESVAHLDLRQNITRAEFAAISLSLYEAMSGETVVQPKTNPFTDTKDPEVLRAYAAGLTKGVTSNKFAPNSLISRQDACVMLARAYKKCYFEDWTIEQDGLDKYLLPYKLKGDYKFADNYGIASYAYNAVYFMYAKAIIAGVGNDRFSPKAYARREDALIIACRMAINLSPSDSEDISFD